MNAIAQFNQLGGKTVTRKSLISLKELAYLEGSHDIIVRVDTVLNSFPEAEAFVLEVIKPAFQTGLGAAQHSGLYREALDDCGRLQKGYKFENGFVVKVTTGEVDKQKFKKGIDKKEVEKPVKKIVNIRKNSAEYKKVMNWKVFTMYALENNFSGEEITNGLDETDKKYGKISKANGIYTISVHSNLWYKAEEFTEQPKPKKVASSYGKKRAFEKKVKEVLETERPSRTKKTASKYGKKKSHVSISEKFPFSKEEIPYETAYRAYTGTSFSPEKRAVSEQNQYFEHLEFVYKKNLKKAKELNKVEEFETKFERYHKGYLKRTLDYLHTRQGLYSSMIAGPAKFPVERMRKKGNAVDNKTKEIIEYQKFADFFKPETNIIKTGSETALSQLEAKLEASEKHHALLLAGNKALKKLRADKKATESDYKDVFINLGFDLETAKKEANYMLKYTYAGFFTTNSSAKIRNIKKQIILEKRLKEKATIVPEGEITFNGGTIVDDYSDNRIKVLFDTIPDAEIRSFLKKGGQAFKWSPKNKAWQRQLNTYYSGSRNDLYKFLGVKIPEPPKKKGSEKGRQDPDAKKEIVKKSNNPEVGKKRYKQGGTAERMMSNYSNKRKNQAEIDAFFDKIQKYENKLIFIDAFEKLDYLKIYENEKEFLSSILSCQSEKNCNTILKEIYNSQAKKTASNVQTLELSKITLDQKRFQNRSKLNQDIVNNIVNNFNETELDPLILWNNKGKNYLLAGHHRYEGLSQLKNKTAPVKFFTGTEAEAVEFAKVKSNSNRSLETPIERAKIYREMSGTKKAIEDKAKEIEGKNASTILNLAALNPNGIVLSSLENLSSGDVQNQGLIKNIADWVGDTRRTYSSLTNAHEKEMFDFLMDKEQSKRITTKADFKQKIYAIAGAFDFEPTNALNLKRFKYQTEGEKVYDDEFSTLKNKVSEKVLQKADLIDRLSNVKRQDFIPADDNSSDIAAKKLAEITSEISRLQKQLIELSQRKGTYTSGGNNQAALFGAVPEPYTFGTEATNLKPTPNAPQQKPIPQKAKSGLMDMEFDSLDMDEGWENLLQDPARNMKIAIWGKPKNGKTSGALQLANYLTKFGHVIYNFVDQGFNKSTKDLWINSGLANKPNATPSDITKSADLERELKKGKFTFCFIDMISDWIRIEKMKPEDFKERFMRQFPEVSFILIFEVTKSGDFKGDQGWTHLVDAIMTVEDFIIENRGRYGMGEKCVWDEGAKKYNPKRYDELFGNSESEDDEILFNEDIEIL